MTQDAIKTARVLELAEVAEKYLDEAGHPILVRTNDAVTAFDITAANAEEGTPRVCRIQAIGPESWEMVLPGGQTLTGLGGKDAFAEMVKRAVIQAERNRAA